MTPLLQTVLHDLHETGERTVAETYDPAAVHQRIEAVAARRRRTVTAVTAVASAACLGLLTVGMGQLGAAPAPEPADSVPDDGRLPRSAPLTPEVLEQAGPGWSLVVYDATALPALDPDGKALGSHLLDGQTGPAVLYLVAPDGTPYEAYEFPPDPDRRAIHLASWDPGATRVLAWVGMGVDTTDTESWSGHLVTIDLADGREVGSFESGESAWLAALTVDGQALVGWDGDDLTWREPDGTRTAAHAVPTLQHSPEAAPALPAATLLAGRDPQSVVLAGPDGMLEAFSDGSTRELAAFPTDALGCSPLRWASTEALVVQCWTAFDPEVVALHGTDLWRLSTAGGAPERLTAFSAQSWEALGISTELGVEVLHVEQVDEAFYLYVVAASTELGAAGGLFDWIVRWDGPDASLVGSQDLADQLAERLAAAFVEEERHPYALDLRGAHDGRLLVAPDVDIPGVLAWLDPETGETEVVVPLVGDARGVVTVAPMNR